MCSRILELELFGTKTLESIDMVWYHFPPRGSNLVNRSGTKMLIKFQADDLLVDTLKSQYGQSVGSKACFLAAEDAPKLLSEVRRLKAELADARQVISVQRQTLEGARAAAAHLLEKVAQGDLLDS